jgi:hypothetical protein
MEATQEQQLDYALNKIMRELVAWGICDSEQHYLLGYRTPETMRLSVAGAINVHDLINTLNSEIKRLEQIIGEKVSQ